MSVWKIVAWIALGVVGVIAVLVVLLITTSKCSPRVRARMAQIEVGQLAVFAERYQRVNGALPAELSALAAPPEGHKAITQEVPPDPWGEPYRFVIVGNTWRVCSVGNDRIPSDDDICSDSRPLSFTRGESQ